MTGEKISEVLQNLSSELYRYLEKYGANGGRSAYVSEYRDSIYTRCVSLLHDLFYEKTQDLSVYILADRLDEEREADVQKRFSDIIFETNESGRPHNPYDQEMREQSAIEQGNLELLRQSIAEDFAGNCGTLAEDDLRNQKNMGIAVITLASRSAIRGGLSPEMAFSLSDSWIQEIEMAGSTMEAEQITRSAEYQYARQVMEIQKQKQGIEKTEKNPYVTQCKNHLFSHLHEKITVKSLAEKIGINANYLSEVFHRCEGLPLSHYILNEKINRAKNLLIYSQYSYVQIASYLGFSSQSHFGTQFKKVTGMTPGKFRDYYAAGQYR